MHQRGLVAAHRVSHGDQGADPLVDLGQQCGGTVEHAVHEADAGGGAGQRSQKLDAPLGRHEVHHHEVDREGLQVGPVPLTNPRRAPSGRCGVCRSRTAPGAGRTA